MEQTCAESATKNFREDGYGCRLVLDLTEDIKGGCGMSGITTEADYWNERLNVDIRLATFHYDDLRYLAYMPSMNYKPKIYLDGDKWCALYRDNIQDSVCGFGKSTEKAKEDFNQNWTRNIDDMKEKTKEASA